MFLVLRKGKRSCGASMSTARVSLYLVNPVDTSGAAGGGVRESRHQGKEGVQAWVNFQRPATWCDDLVEAIKGLTVGRQDARLKGKVQGPMP